MLKNWFCSVQWNQELRDFHYRLCSTNTSIREGQLLNEILKSHPVFKHLLISRFWMNKADHNHMYILFLFFTFGNWMQRGTFAFCQIGLFGTTEAIVCRILSISGPKTSKGLIL